MTPLAPEDVQSYPRPPRLDPVPQTIRLEVDGLPLVTTTTAWRVCETHHPPTYYLPPEAFPEGVLRPSPGGSFCEWKGRAAYADVIGAKGPILRAAWFYPAPTPAFAPIAGHVAVYLSARIRGWLDDTEAQPQPGGFYGGWVTPNLSGRIKGPPGTTHW
jgi:uncharacterized protein (DUF427 family)